MNKADLERERRIDELSRKFSEQLSLSESIATWREMRDLINGRSPEAIFALELQKNLVV